MRHGKKFNKLSRPAEHRKALLNNLAIALITNKQIQTTDAKAKALKPYIDRLISTAIGNSLHAKRLIARQLPNKTAFKELFNVVVPKLEGRTSGFTRIVKYKTRRGDGAPLSIIELLIEKEEETHDKKSKKKSKAAAKPAHAKEKKVEHKAETPVEEPPAPEPETEVELAATETETEETPQEPEDTVEQTDVQPAEEPASEDEEKKE